ncbi:MAG: SPFH domain-containing protein [Fusobacteriota bacterium]
MQIISIVLGIFVIIFIAKGVRIIHQAEVMIVERLGKYHKTLESGLNFIIPIIDSPRTIIWKYVETDTQGVNTYASQMVSKIDLRETVYDFPKQNVITKDNVTIQINALIYFQIIDPKKTTYEINNVPNAIEKLTQTTLRNVIGELDLDETLVSRDTINNKLRLILDEATDKWGVKVNRVELQDIIPPKEIRDAMEKQMKAERTKRALILEAQGKKEAEIKKAEGVRRSKILHAEGKAEARLKVAQAESEAIGKISKSMNGDPMDPANYLIAIKYIDNLKELAQKDTDKVVFMPYETSSVLSSIGGIKELIGKNKLNM